MTQPGPDTLSYWELQVSIHTDRVSPLVDYFRQRLGLDYAVVGQQRTGRVVIHHEVSRMVCDSVLTLADLTDVTHKLLARSEIDGTIRRASAIYYTDQPARRGLNRWPTDQKGLLRVYDQIQV